MRERNNQANLSSRSHFVLEVTTLRRHMQARRKVCYAYFSKVFAHRSYEIYQEWCRNNDFDSRLPKDMTARKEALAQEAEHQQTPHGYLKELPPKERVIKYSE